jgi:hypothetical protein
MLAKGRRTTEENQAEVPDSQHGFPRKNAWRHGIVDLESIPNFRSAP